MEIKNISNAIDIAGKQRMFTQKILKDYAMIGMENKFANPTEDLKKVITDFETHLNSLYEFTKDEATKKSIQEAKTLWTPIKKRVIYKTYQRECKKTTKRFRSTT